MPTLLELQEAVKDFMLGEGNAGAYLVVGDGLAPGDRLGIYRNTCRSTLANALRLSYPAVMRLVGGDFFKGSALAFIDAHPATSAYLNDYGAEFADFLAAFPPAGTIPYLPDVARLEWAVNIALHAADVPALDSARLQRVSTADLAFVAHPSVTLLELAYPADAIWRAVIDGDDKAVCRIDLSDGPVFVVVSRGSEGVGVERMSREAWAFSAALFSGVPLSGALEKAHGDMSTVLARHFAEGRFTDFRFPEQRSAA